MNENKDKEFLLLGIKSVDSQHQMFFDLLGELKTQKEKRELDIAQVRLLNKFKGYAQYHFELEERIMSDVKYDKLEDHIKQHEFFIKKIEEFELAISYQSANLSEQMLNFLQKWFLGHIKEWDQNYVDFINEREDIDHEIYT